jgi:hypothetical protein
LKLSGQLNGSLASYFDYYGAASPKVPQFLFEAFVDCVYTCMDEPPAFPVAKIRMNSFSGSRPAWNIDAMFCENETWELS